jgi:hypothetical protein
MTGVGLGWLQGTTKTADNLHVLSLLSAATGAEQEPRPGGTRWYAESAMVGRHTLVAWSPRNRPDVAETYVEVRQSALDELGGAAALALAVQLLASGVRFSRADGYYDDRVRHAEPGTVADAFRRGDVLTHIRHLVEICGFVTAGPDGVAVPSGATTYVGSAKSETRLRVYDKAAESGRPDAGIRWEVQLRGGHAARFVAGAVAAGEDLGAYVLACIRGLADFRDRSGQERGDRAPLLAWWAAIVGDAERVLLSGPAKVDSLEKRGAWLSRQAAPTLALCYFAYGSGWLDALLRSGEERLTEAEWRLLGPRYTAGRGES